MMITSDGCLTPSIVVALLTAWQRSGSLDLKPSASPVHSGQLPTTPRADA